VGEPWVAVVARTFAPRWDDGHDVSLVDGRRVNVATAALGTEPGQILLIKDVTQTRRLQDQLDHHRRLSAKTELAAVLAHQVRTPLATALLQLGNLNRAGLAPEAQQRARSKALDAMRQLERLVEDMLSYARGGVLEAEPIRVQHLLDIVEQSVAAQQDDDAFTFELRRPETDVWISGNRSALLSIILNLVNNARAATAGRGRLRLDLTVDSAELICRFSDNGPGIAPANRSQIFEPFFTTRQNGTGLGLSVARAIARAHAGDLELDETALEGACFVLRLPLTPGVER
jgi:two-component system sensor histidine kinase FlrB